MLKRISALASFILFATALHAAPTPDSPALQVFKQWLAAFNSGDRASISAFWKQYGGAGTNDHIAGDLRLREMTGGMSIFRVEEDTETHVAVLMKEGRGVWSESTLDLASTHPPIIARMGGHPVAAPDSAAAPAASDSELAARVEEHIAKTTGPDAFSGAALVAHDGHIVLEKAWGMADIKDRIPNAIGTQFCIGSMNKMFTAVAILQLVQQDKIALDNPIANYWPDYPNHDLAARVTVRELLNHTGGTGDIFTPEYAAHRQQVRTLADYVQLFGNRPMAFAPGSRMEYSNYGFILLGRIIELVSGQSYDNYLREHVFLPAGMLHTDSRPEADHIAGRAIGYIVKPDGLVPNTDMLPWSGTSAGGGYSTVHDLFLFAQALEHGTALRADLLKEATVASKLRNDYGLGFYVLPHGAYGHGGGGPGINAELHILPQGGYIIVALANRDPQAATHLVDFITQTVAQPAAAFSPDSRQKNGPGN